MTIGRWGFLTVTVAGFAAASLTTSTSSQARTSQIRRIATEEAFATA